MSINHRFDIFQLIGYSSTYIKQEGTNKGPFFCPERDSNTDDEVVNIIKGYMTKKEGDN